MEDYNRSKSYGPGMAMEREGYYLPQPSSRPPTSYELQCYSASYAQTQMSNYNKDVKTEKAKRTTGSSSSSSSNWTMSDPEFQRKKRVASYKMYSVEGKMKGTFRKSFRWLKDRYTRVLYGWW